MANADHVKILKQGVKDWNEWRKNNPHIKPDLSGIKLKGAKLWGINFSETDLSGAQLKGATLLKSNMIEANLQDANMEDTRLMIAEMWGANLTNTVLTNSDLRMAEMGDTNMTQAVLKNVNFGRANLMAANLTEANLENCILIETNLNDVVMDNTNISGITFYRCTSYGWTLKKIKCDYIYTDVARKNRKPKDSPFLPGEFEDLFKSKPTMEFNLDHAITWIDSLLIEIITGEMEKEKPGFGLKLLSYDARGGQSRAIFAIASQDLEDDAVKELQKRYEVKSKMIENNMDYMFQFILQANKLPQDSVLLNQELEKLQNVHLKNVNICTNAINEIKSTVEKEPDSTFIKRNKRQILDEIEICQKNMMNEGLKSTGERIMKLTQTDLIPILPEIITQLAVLNLNKHV